jgi:prolyl oligopeptidase
LKKAGFGSNKKLSPLLRGSGLFVSRASLALSAMAAAMLLYAGPALAETASPDPNIWLEDVYSPRALEWVRAHDAKALGVLAADTHYKIFYQQALALEQASDRIPRPEFLGAQIGNFWQDAAHAQGVWRRTSLDDYRHAAPDWRVMLDLDALSKSDQRHWVFKGDTCWQPVGARCLVALSDGGEDAVTEREFDVPGKSFVPDGFVIPRAKQAADWLDQDTLLVATDWGPGSMTASGYPFIVKRLHRGQSLAQATEVFRGTPQDVSVQVQALTDGQGHHVVVLQRGIDFFRSEFRLVTGTGTTRLALPEKADIEGLLADRLIVKINEDFGPRLKAGSIVALDLLHPDAPPLLVFAPGARQTVDEVATTANTIVAAVYDNVRGRAMVFTPSAGGFSARRLDLPDNASVHMVATTARDDSVFLEVTSFLVPTALYLADAGSGAAPEKIKALPEKFDASRDMVDQYEAVSADGTRIPYFVVHPKDMKPDGRNPTLMTAYGGFQISMTPAYSATVGKLWLERGGVYVLANIRGGGEFGPAWHEAGLTTKRQHIYDDFAAVARDLMTRKITSPSHLGIRGGSNGGLLMGVEFEQHPDLWGAVIIDVPLLDMLRYEKIAAGASWVGEYGSVDKADERAFLAKISPYANLKPGVHYPVPYIFTTTRDDRVGPVHARKFAARMEQMGLPFYYYESVEGGHAGAANLRERAQEEALEMTYLSMQLKM